MKVRTTCPECSQEIITEVTSVSSSAEITCPACQHNFIIRHECAPNASEDCVWEEHGEPRKTVLSSLRYYSSKPMTASFLLLTTFVLGIFTAGVLISSEQVVIPYFNITLEMFTSLLGTYGFAILILIFSSFAMVGFAVTLTRKFFPLAVISAFISIFSIGFLLGIILACIAFILILLSREEFEYDAQGRIF